MTWTAILIWLPWILFLVYSAATVCCTWRFARAAGAEPGPDPDSWPPVTIVKPLAAVDEHSLENLATFCVQDYPRYEIVFALQEEDPAILAVVERLQSDHPDLAIHRVIARHNRGPNYKVGNLAAALEKASSELLAMSDSDMRVEPDYLRQLVRTFHRPGVGLVTCLYRSRRIANATAALQALTLQTDFIPNVLFDHQWRGISYAFGATICTTRTILEQIGGINQLRHYLADDYLLGNRVLAKGYRVELAPFLVDHIGNVSRFHPYFLHQLRWAVTQRVCRPAGYRASVITRGLFLSLFPATWLHFSPTGLSLVAFTCVLRWLHAVLVDRRLVRNPEIRRYLWLVPANDLLNTWIWMLSLVKNTVRWHNRTFRVSADGRMKEI